MNEQFEKMVDQVLKYKPPTKGKKAEREEAEKLKPKEPQAKKRGR